MARFRLLIWCAFLITALCISGCGSGSDEGTNRDDVVGEEDDDDSGDDDSASDGIEDMEPDFVLSGGIYRNSPNDNFVELRLNDIVDNPENLQLDLLENIDVELPSLFASIDENNFLVLEDGAPRDASIVQTKDSKAKGAARVYVMYDWTDSMWDEHVNALASIQDLLDDLTASYNPLRVYINLFKDWAADWRYLDTGNWPNNVFYNNVYNYLMSPADGFGGQGTIAENPLNAIDYRWSNGGYHAGIQTIFLLVTDGPMHQRGDNDSFDWPYSSGLLTTEVAANLVGGSYNPKGTVWATYTVRTHTYAWDPQLWAYWDNRNNYAPSTMAGQCAAPPTLAKPHGCWTTDNYWPHETPYQLAVQTAGNYYNLDAHGPGSFYPAKKGLSSMQNGISLVYESSDATAEHDVVVTVSLEDGRWGEIVFENINYADLSTTGEDDIEE